jgi:hypothetical protein
MMRDGVPAIALRRIVRLDIAKVNQHEDTTMRLQLLDEGTLQTDVSMH